MKESKQIREAIHAWMAVFMHRSMRDFKRFMTDTGLSFSHVSILMWLLHGNCLGVSDIGEKMGVTNAAASQSIEKLVQMDLVRRSEDPDDRRAKRLEITSKGRTLIQQGMETRIRWVDGLAETLTPEQQNAVVQTLSLLTEAAKRTEE